MSMCIGYLGQITRWLIIDITGGMYYKFVGKSDWFIYTLYIFEVQCFVNWGTDLDIL